MNTDDFEITLRKQRPRRLPEAWREEILGAARAAVAASCRANRGVRLESARAWLRELLWPCPQAWAGLTAAWIVIWAVNATGPDPAAHRMQAQSSRLSAELLAALQEQRQFRAELTEVALDLPEQPPATAVPGKRDPGTNSNQNG